MDKKKIIFVIFFIVFIFLGIASSLEKSENYVKSFLEKQGIQEESIKNISEVNKSEFPKQILISNMEENNVGIYEVEYFEQGSDKNLFVISYVAEKIQEIPQEVVKESMAYLDYTGQGGIIGEYLMVDSGSIVGLSSVASFSGKGDLNIEVYKNGIPLGLSNEIYSEGNNYDYVLQSDNVNLFYPGDLISVKVEQNNLKVNEVNSIVKVNIH